MTTQDTQLQLSQIGQISVNVHDLDGAVSFYRNTLGMPFLFQVPKMAFFDLSGVRLVLAEPETPEFDHPASVIYYRVEDIESACQVLKDRGVEFRAEPRLIAKMEDHDLWMAFFDDVAGNTLALMSEVVK